MKKILTTIMMCMLLSPLATAQVDTVQWKCNRYHYSWWYDTLPEFYDTIRTSVPMTELRLYPWSGERRYQVLAMPSRM